MQEETRWMQSRNEPYAALMGATAFQRQMGSLFACVYLTRGALAAKDAGAPNAEEKLVLAKVFAAHELPGYASARTRVRLAELLSSDSAKAMVGLK